MVQRDYTGTERRKFVRIPFWFITNYRPYTQNIETLKDFHQGIGRNISVGGICFEAKDRFNKDTILEIEIDMPALEHSVTVIGQIVWTYRQENTGSYAYGLVFTKINPNDIEAVKKIIDTFA